MRAAGRRTEDGVLGHERRMAKADGNLRRRARASNHRAPRVDARARDR